ncbi:hypothetical protein ACTXT7_003116 [Hymenolepis weldensis]
MRVHSQRTYYTHTHNHSLNRVFSRSSCGRSLVQVLTLSPLGDATLFPLVKSDWSKCQFRACKLWCAHQPRVCVLIESGLRSQTQPTSKERGLDRHTCFSKLCQSINRSFNRRSMFSSPDLGVLAAAFHPNGLNNSSANTAVSPPNSNNSNSSATNNRFPQSNDPNENNFRNGFCSRQSAFSSPEKGFLSPRQNSYVGVTVKICHQGSRSLLFVKMSFFWMLNSPPYCLIPRPEIVLMKDRTTDLDCPSSVLYLINAEMFNKAICGFTNI